MSLVERLHIDDPVGCIPTHCFSSIWGLIAVGLFVETDRLEDLSKEYGVLKGGRWELLGVQLLCIVVIIAWALVTSFVLLFIIDKTMGLRMPLQMEIEGADKWEHGIDIRIDGQVQVNAARTQIFTPRNCHIQHQRHTLSAVEPVANENGGIETEQNGGTGQVENGLEDHTNCVDIDDECSTSPRDSPN